MHAAEARRCIRDCDVTQMRKLWQHLAPHLPQPKDDAEALISMHYARTVAEFVPLNGRAYSHRWLLDGGYPSGLPDDLKPNAERIYPRVVEGVGIASQSSAGAKNPFNFTIEKVMADAVLEAYADGHEHEPHIVKARILEKRSAFKRRA